MTNEQLKERIKLLERIIELETKLGLVKSDGALVENAPWYPDDRNWIEYNPSMNIDRSHVAQAMTATERDCKEFYETHGINFAGKGLDSWDDEFSWRSGDENIVAVLMKE